MLEFSSNKIKLNHFHVDNNKDELVIGYDTIIGNELMVQICVMDNFKNKVLQCDDNAVPMKNPKSFLGQGDLIRSYICSRW